MKTGDIISIDIGATLNGYVGDAAVTLPVGEVDEETQKLLEVTEQLVRRNQKAMVNNRLSDISHAVQTYAESHGFSVVQDFVGHGIGRSMHEDPRYRTLVHLRGPRLKAGMVLAIEPMVNVGGYEVDTLKTTGPS